MGEREARVRELLPEIGDIKDPVLAEKVTALWVRAWNESEWETLDAVPKNDRLPEVTLIAHVRGVTRASQALARVAMELYDGVEIDMDLITASALLHDVSKPLENSPEGKTKVGKLFPHAHLGAQMAHEAGLPDELVHIIVTHSRNSSPMPPSTYEGLIVHYADYADSDVLNVRYGKKLLLSFK